MSAPVDVLAVMKSFCMFGGTFEPVRFVAEWNVPRGTGLIANRANVSTAIVRRELVKAERAGAVERVGTGAIYNKAWNKSAAEEKEIYWRIAPAALAAVGGAK